jgi:uncharacterized protein (TIGR03118 family)
MPPSTPTGIVGNSTMDFQLSSGNPSIFLFATEDGTLSGWNPKVNMTQAILKVTTPNAVYKGLTIGQMSGKNVLYAANFRSGKIEAYDTNFAPVSLAAGAFTDNEVPAGYAPFNVQNIGGNIFVGWAQQDAQKHDEMDGPGLGYVDEFGPDGTLILRLEHGNYMNAPWGLVKAPLLGFGQINRILVGNFGSGQIAAFNARTGKFTGLLKEASGAPITIDGLWGIEFGNNGSAGSSKALYFAAGPGGEMHGVFGNITFNKK